MSLEYNAGINNTVMPPYRRPLQSCYMHPILCRGPRPSWASGDEERFVLSQRRAQSEYDH